MITVKCKVCDKLIQCYESTKHKKKYCSKECRDKDQFIITQCLTCNKSFKVAKSLFNSQNFIFKNCSRQCYDLFKLKNFKESELKKTHICRNCGKMFVAFRSKKFNVFFCSKQCNSEYKKGENNCNYKGGYTINSAGYMCIKVGDKYLYEHRLIMEEFLNRKLDKNEVVHHKDGNKLNNDLNNLELMTKHEHDIFHTKQRQSISNSNECI